MTLVWLVLMVATALSWRMAATPAGVTPQSDGWAATAILLIALFKVWLVIRHFMEVRHAPPALRRICDAWVGLCLVATLSAYWLA